MCRNAVNNSEGSIVWAVELEGVRFGWRREAVRSDSRTSGTLMLMRRTLHNLSNVVRKHGVSQVVYLHRQVLRSVIIVLAEVLASTSEKKRRIATGGLSDVTYAGTNFDEVILSRWDVGCLMIS